MEFRDKKVSVVGLERSGVGAAVVLKESGASVFGSDFGIPATSFLKELEENNIEFETSGHTSKVLESDIIVLSPGVPVNSEIVKMADKNNIPIISEIELAFQLTNADIVGVTGSNGKSTTVTLIDQLLKKGKFKSALGGNIGVALTKSLQGLGKEDVLIAEISSFQLDSIKTFRPKIAVVLNLTPDHLDRYPSEMDYYLSKIGISKNQTESDYLVINEDDENISKLMNKFSTSPQMFTYSLNKPVQRGAFVENEKIMYTDGNYKSEITSVNKVALKGLHNLSNILSAVVVAKLTGIKESDIKEVLLQFSGIEHRMEFVLKKKNIKFYNDSKATNIDSLKWALLSLSSQVNLIAGGRDKDSDFNSIKDVIGEKVSSAYLLGEAAEKIDSAWKDYTDVVIVKDMTEAVKSAYENSKDNGVVLLSPACASFDMYSNFEERGKNFKEIVKSL